MNTKARKPISALKKTLAAVCTLSLVTALIPLNPTPANAADLGSRTHELKLETGTESLFGSADNKISFTGSDSTQSFDINDYLQITTNLGVYAKVDNSLQGAVFAADSQDLTWSYTSTDFKIDPTTSLATLHSLNYQNYTGIIMATATPNKSIENIDGADIEPLVVNIKVAVSVSGVTPKDASVNYDGIDYDRINPSQEGNKEISGIVISAPVPSSGIKSASWKLTGGAIEISGSLSVVSGTSEAFLPINPDDISYAAVLNSSSLTLTTGQISQADITSVFDSSSNNTRQLTLIVSVTYGGASGSVQLAEQQTIIAERATDADTIITVAFTDNADDTAQTGYYKSRTIQISSNKDYSLGSSSARFAYTTGNADYTNLVSHSNNRITTTSNTYYATSDGVYDFSALATARRGASGGTAIVKYTVNGTQISNSDAALAFVVDNTAPKVSVQYSDSTYLPWRVESQYYKYYTAKTVTVTVKDNGFGVTGNILTRASSIDFKYKFIPAGSSAEQTETISLDYSGNDGGTSVYSKTVSLSQEGTYNFSGSVLDPAGNSSGVPAISDLDNQDISPTFILDHTDPQIKIDSAVTVIPSSGFSAINGLFTPSLTYNNITATNFNVTFSATDPGFGTAGIQALQYVQIQNPDQFAQADFSGSGGLIHERTQGWTNYVSGVDLLANSRTAYIVRAIDNAGNVSYAATEGILFDLNAPVIETDSISVTPTAPQSGIYTDKDTPIVISFDVTDDSHGVSSYSGVDTVSYTISTVSEGNIDSDTLVEPLASTIANTWANLSSRAKVQDLSITIDPSDPKFERNNLKVEIFAKDKAGLTAVSAVYLSIDITAPTIDVTFTDNGAQNEKYFNAPRIAIVQVTDRNFSDATSILHDYPANWNQIGLTAPDGTEVWQTELAFAKDGDYTFSVSATDKAGLSTSDAQANYTNYTTSIARHEFVVDLTAPVLSVMYDNNSARNGNYFNAQRIGTVSVAEHNFSESGATLSATKDGGSLSPSSSWASNNDTHTINFTYSTDGNYSFAAAFTDLAGNLAEPLELDEFIIDLTRPTLEFVGNVQDGTAHPAEVVPSVIFHDANYDPLGVTLSLQGYKNGQVYPYDSYQDIADGQQATLADMEHIQKNDDIYILQAQVIDMAGNTYEDSITYSVNRFGSTWYLSDATGQLIDKYYINTAEDIEIHEVNVTSVTKQKVTYSNSGTTTELERGQDYISTVEGGSGAWRDYSYKLKASNFNTEGLYEITVLTEDAVGNTSTNHTPRVADSAAPVNFVLDKTAPTIVLTGADDNGRYTETERVLKIDVQDNLALGNTDVYLNGSNIPVATYTADDVKQAGGVVEFVIPAGDSYQDVSVQAIDLAGNATSPVKIQNIFVNPSPLAQFAANTPLFFGVIIGIIALIAAGLFLFSLAKKRRRKDEEVVGIYDISSK